MRLAALLLALFVLVSSSPAQKQLAHSPRILNAKTVFFLNTTGSDAVGSEALAQLKKWGKYQLVSERSRADLIFLLSADPYHAGDVLLANGQTGTIHDDGRITTDAVPTYSKAAPSREAYLSVIDPHTGENLWSDHHVWGGLLTGFNSVGARLIRKLASQTKP
jgi:hypothetical protein